VLHTKEESIICFNCLSKKNKLLIVLSLKSKTSGLLMQTDGWINGQMDTQTEEQMVAFFKKCALKMSFFFAVQQSQLTGRHSREVAFSFELFHRLRSGVIEPFHQK
jgi:hypothetical protein